jgi:hypothetical protein
MSKAACIFSLTCECGPNTIQQYYEKAGHTKGRSTQVGKVREGSLEGEYS